MSMVNELRARRAKIWEQAKAFLDEKRDANGILNAEDTAAYEKMESDIAALGREIERQERADSLDRELAAPVNTPLVARPEAPKADIAKGRAYDSYRKAFWNAMRSRAGAGYEIRNALEEGVNEEGGYLVPDEFERTLVQGLEDRLLGKEYLS